MQSAKQEKKPEKPYALNLDRREKLTLSGVSDVLSFDENQVELLTEGGQLCVSGQNLHVARLNLEEGQLALTGTVDSLVYLQPGRIKRASLAARIFR